MTLVLAVRNKDTTLGSQDAKIEQQATQLREIPLRTKEPMSSIWPRNCVGTLRRCIGVGPQLQNCLFFPI